MRFKLEGIFPAMVTPFTKGGKKVDYDKARAVAKRLVKQGVHGLFICGTTGEGPLMSPEERKTMLETVIDEVGGKCTVIAHTGCFDTATTIELTRHARDCGAQAAGAVAPGFFTHDYGALAAHYRAVAASVPGYPVLLYNLPSCAKNRLTPPLVLELAKTVDNIVGMKDSGGDIVSLNAVLAEAPADFTVINGTDEYTYQAYKAGARGSVSSTANVVPKLFLKIFNAVKKGDDKTAWEAQKTLSKACHHFHYGAMVAFYKEGLRLQGVDAGHVRPPQRELTREERRELAKALKSLGLV